MEDVSWPYPTTSGVFTTTRWALVEACSHQDEDRSREAIAELCQAYWKPVYACVRHHGHCPVDAEDITQDFFLHLLRRRHLQRVDQQRGRFRAYLSAALQNFLCDRWRRRWTWRKGRGVSVISLDSFEAERSYASVPFTKATPQSQYERRWALQVIEYALEQLKIELVADRKEILLTHFDAILTARTHHFPYGETAVALGVTLGALHGLLHRWRRRFHALVREEIARTVLSKADIEDELRHLLECVRR